MAKKGGAVQLQIEVDNEENWDLLVEREGLILVDVYSDWCGPCSGMLGNLRKIKLELGGDTLSLAAAKCDNIPCLERFKNKSRPTWMFISNKRMIRLMFGADAPRLISILVDEIKLTKRAIAEHTPREGIDFDQLTEEEQAVADEEARIKEEADRIEREAREKAINERREEVVENLMEHLKEYNLVMTWPHVTNDVMAQIFNAVKETPLSVAGKPVKHRLTEEDLYEILYYSTWEYSDIEKEALFSDEVTGLLFQAPMGDEESDTIDIFLEKFYGATKAPPGDEESLAVKLSTIVKIKVEEPTEDEEGGERPRTSDPKEGPRKSRKTSATMGSQRKSTIPEEEENMIEVAIPALFVPENDKCKNLAMRILFPNVTQKFDLPEPEPIPPRLVCVFDAFKKNEVLQLASEWPEGTMRYGFFTSADPNSAELIAKSSDQYDRIHVPPYDAKLVVQVSKKKSEPLLSYSLLGPMYVSPNCVVGEKECDLFFPEGYDEPEIEPEPEEIVPKKKKKRGRGSKTSVSSKTEESGEESREGGSEEGLEEIEEEGEGDEGDDDDMDDMSFDPLADYQEPSDLLGPPPEEVVEADKATTTESTE